MSSNDVKLHNLVREALLNNSYDYSAMHNTINQAWKNSFSYLYYLQQAKIEYEEIVSYSNDEESRYYKDIGKLYLNKSLYACFNVKHDCVGYYREEYRTSKYYGNIISFEDMIYNPKIFHTIPVVIIDDKVIYDYKVKISHDSTIFELPFKRSFVLEDIRNSRTDDIIYKDHKIQILMIENIYYQRFKLNRTLLNYDATNKKIHISRYKMDEMTYNNIVADVNSEYMKMFNKRYASELTATEIRKIDKEIERRLAVVKIPDFTGTFFASLHFANVAGKYYELGTELLELEYDAYGNFFINLPDSLADKIGSTPYPIYMSVVFFNRLHSHTFHHNSRETVVNDDGPDIAVIEKDVHKPYECPIPAENFMVFKKPTDSDRFYLERNINSIDLYYPNIYMINEDKMTKGDTYKIYYFYYELPDLKYTVMFDFYFKFLLDISHEQSLEKIINDIYYDRYDYGYTDEEKVLFKRVFDRVLDYMTYHYKYGDMDFMERYMKEPENIDKVPIQYKDETLKSWIADNPWILRDYVYEQNKVGSSYHLYANTLDLESRKRRNTVLELGINNRYDFDEDRYVFAFSNEREYPDLLDCRIFVDGILVGDVYQRRKAFMDYFYVPCDMVESDSYIELEVFPRYSMEKSFRLESMEDSVDIDIVEPDENILPTIADMIVWEESDLTKPYRITASKYSGHYPDINGIMVDDDRYVTYEAIIGPKTKSISSTIAVINEGFEYSVISFYDSDHNLLKSYSNTIYEPNVTPRYGDDIVALDTYDPYTMDNDQLIYELENEEAIEVDGLTFIQLAETIPSKDRSTDHKWIVDAEVPEGAMILKIVTYKDIIEDIVIDSEVEYREKGWVRSRYDQSEFKVTAKYSRGDQLVRSDTPDKPVKFTRLVHFSISANTRDAVGKDFKLKFAKVPQMIRCTIDVAGYCYIDLKTDNFQFSTEYIRVFRNGRLVPKNKYRLLTGYNKPRLLLMEWFDIGDLLYIDITPYRYTQIYHKKTLLRKGALIDLKGVINKPFDVRYYDIYLNGRKLSYNNIFTITPWKIAIVNMKSNYNLDIYEKERDWEYFGLDYAGTTYYFSFDELVNSQIVSDEEFKKLIIDRINELKDPRLVIHPNTFDEEPLDYGNDLLIYPIFFIFYYDELVPKTYVNPDELQFNVNFIRENFEEIDHYYKEQPIDSSRNEFERERKIFYPPALCLDPDTWVETNAWRETPIIMRLKDKNPEDVYTDEHGNLIVDIERVPNKPGDVILNQDHYYIDSNGNAIDRNDDEENTQQDDNFYFTSDDRLVYEVDDDTYIDEEDQPIVPDDTMYLRIKDNPGNDGWYYDENGNFVLDVQRRKRSGIDIIYDLDDDVYIDELEEQLMNGARLAYDVGHTGDIPNEYFENEIEMGRENSIYIEEYERMV